MNSRYAGLLPRIKEMINGCHISFGTHQRLGDLCTDYRIMLKGDLTLYGIEKWTELNWLEMGYFCEHGSNLLRYIKVENFGTS
jgi:hypothetical protein